MSSEYHEKYFLNRSCMCFHPENIPLKIFLISFIFLLTYCVECAEISENAKQALATCKLVGLKIDIVTIFLNPATLFPVKVQSMPDLSFPMRCFKSLDFKIISRQSLKFVKPCVCSYSVRIFN